MIATRETLYRTDEAKSANCLHNNTINNKQSKSHQYYNIRFPQETQNGIAQDDERVEILNDNEAATTTIRFHNYAEIYRRPGLYEQLFDDILQCTSPYVVVGMLKENQHYLSGEPLRVFDFGAGNGLVGRELRKMGVDYTVGCDILPEAKKAALRDYPGVYNDYLAKDLTNLSDSSIEKLEKANFNALTVVSALAFGDIPRAAFVSAARFVKRGGLIMFNLKDQFYDADVESEFASLIKENVEKGVLEIVAQQYYQHRLSVTGEPLFYYAFASIKHGDIF